MIPRPAYGGRRLLGKISRLASPRLSFTQSGTLTMGKRSRALASKFLLRLLVMSCFIIHPVGNRGAFSITEKAPD